MSLSDFPRYPLTFGPSPVHPLDRLTAHLGGAADLGQARGRATPASPTAATRPASSSTSSPTRSPRAPTRWSRSAAYQSNHTRQVAAVAAHARPEGRAGAGEAGSDWPDPVNDQVGNILLSRIMGADVRLDPAGFGIGFKRLAGSRRIADVEARGGTPYAIPAGASDHRLGGLGFANWAYEVAAAGGASSASSSTRSSSARVTGSTHAGMIAGFAGAQEPAAAAGASASTPRPRSTRPATRSPGSPATPPS